MAISLQRVIRSTSCLVLGWGFRGRRIERRYLRFEQIQDGGRRHIGKISNGHISTTAHDLLIARIARAVIFAIAQLSSFFCDWWLWSLVNFLSRFGLPASGLPSPLCATFRFNKLQLVDIRKKEKNKRLNNLIYFLCSNGMTANFTAPWQSCYRVCLLSNNL